KAITSNSPESNSSAAQSTHAGDPAPSGAAVGSANSGNGANTSGFLPPVGDSDPNVQGPNGALKALAQVEQGWADTSSGGADPSGSQSVHGGFKVMASPLPESGEEDTNGSAGPLGQVV